MRMSRRRFEGLVRQAYAGLPAPAAARLHNLDIIVQDAPGPEAEGALDLDDGLTDAWRIRGRARYRMGQFEAAAGDFDRAVVLAPRQPEPLYWRGLATRDAGRNGDAIADFTAVIALNDRYTEAYVARGKAYAALGNLTAARSDWAVAAQMLHQSH